MVHADSLRAILFGVLVGTAGCLTPGALTDDGEISARSTASLSSSAVSISTTQIRAFGGQSQADWVGFLNPSGNSSTPQASFFASILGDLNNRPSHAVTSPWPGGVPNYVADNDLATVGLDFNGGDSVAFVPNGGDNPANGDIDRKGESFVLIKSNASTGGIGTYVHVGPPHFLGREQAPYVSPLDRDGLQASSGGVWFEKVDRILYPFQNASGSAMDLRIELRRTKMVVGDLPASSVGVAQCRFNNNIIVENAASGLYMGINVRAYTLVNDAGSSPAAGTGMQNNANPLHYNLYASDGRSGARSIKDKSSGKVVADSFGAPHGSAPNPNGVDQNIRITFSQFKNILTLQAIGEGSTPEAMFGTGWDDRKNWRIKSVAVRMEITGPEERQYTTRCGGSLGEMIVSTELH